MELRHLRYFVAVAEELHFRRAADRLRVSQPAVSEQVRKLEEELGVQLLERTHRRVTLTRAGGRFLPEARRVLQLAERARRAAMNMGEKGNGRLRLGLLPDTVPAALPRTLGRFARATPGVEVVLETHPALELIERVRDRQLDAALICLPAPVSGLRVTRLGEAGQVVVISHPEHTSIAVSAFLHQAHAVSAPAREVHLAGIAAARQRASAPLSFGDDDPPISEDPVAV